MNIFDWEWIAAKLTENEGFKENVFQFFDGYCDRYGRPRTEWG